MKPIPLTHYLPDVSPIAFGCMGLGASNTGQTSSAGNLKIAQAAIDAALQSGINFFDHADIYSHGRAESVFGQILKLQSDLRDRMYLQSKCAIRLQDENSPKRYDHSKAWVTQSVEDSLRRLNTEYLDILLLHRPDPLMDVTELALTMEALQKSGKVKHFGVSNMHRFQVELLNYYSPTPMIVNQLEMSLSKLDFLEQGVTVAMKQNATVGFDAGTLEYCQMNGVQLQSWGSLSQGLFSGNTLTGEAPHIVATAELVNRFSQKYQVSKEAVVLAWLMKLPYSIQPVIGTTNPSRIKACAQAEQLSQLLTREDWYALYISARRQELP